MPIFADVPAGNTFTAVSGRQSLNGGATLDLRPAAGVRVITTMKATANIDVGLYDGTNFDSVFASGDGGTIVGNPTRGPAIKNTSGGALTVSYAGYDVT